MAHEISVRQLLEVLGEFDAAGGASLGLVAWELCVEEQRVVDAWEQAHEADLIKSAGADRVSGEHLRRLTPGG